MSKPGIEELRAVLVAMKAKTDPTIDQVLYEVRVHVIRFRRQAFCVVMPDGDAQPVL